ncbi:hypothetical protein CBS101457_005990 [Exobasidium rhododendri]|nr:hypothetical protein CBS101457_005990 [Exobasidium rhododendri]
MDYSGSDRRREGGALPSAMAPQAGPASNIMINSEASSSTPIPHRISHQPAIASPLRLAINTPSPSLSFDDNSPTASPLTSVDQQSEEALRPVGVMQRAKSHLDVSGGESSGSGSGSITPTPHALPLHHSHQTYQEPTTSNDKRRHSDTDHLSVHMDGSSLSGQWSSVNPSQQQMHLSQSRFVPLASDGVDLRRGETSGTGLLSTNFVSGALALGPGGYTSSVDADYYSLPPSRLVSRTPTPVLSDGQVPTNSMILNAAPYQSSSPVFASSTATESDGDESDFPSAPGWGGAKEVASMFGFGSKGNEYKRLSGKSNHIMETRKGRKWNDLPDTPTMESQSGYRGKDRSKGFEIAAGLTPKMRSGALLDPRSSRMSRRKKQSSSSKIPWPFRVFTSLLFKTFRTFFGPIHPLTIMIALALIAGFVTSVTMLIIYILNPDKEPLPWRTYCQQQMPFPHAYADALAPVNVLVGVLTIDSKYERRNIIRQTYARHTLPTNADGHPSSNVQVKFILGKVRKSHARRIALEMETFNDIVVLDMEETQSARKTLGFMKWASENATVPFLRPVGENWSNLNTVVPNAALPGGLSDYDMESSTVQRGEQRYQLGWKKVDYVVKADDDSFIVLSELERHLRVAPRRMTYWGYLIKNWFMGGEAYALSFDLVEWLAHSSEVSRSAKGKEDTRTPQWIAFHPNRSSINWVSEHCWIYDHPKGGSPYSHGFLFPDYVEKIKLEARRGLSEQEIAYRGGERASQSYSTVTKWHQKYSGPRRDLTIEEEVEALVEGGGRWAGTWVRNQDGSEGESWMPYQDIVYQADDARLSPSVTSVSGNSVLAEDAGWEPISRLHIYGSIDSSDDTSATNTTTSATATSTTIKGASQEAIKERDLLADLTKLPSHLLGHPSDDEADRMGDNPSPLHYSRQSEYSPDGSLHHQPHHQHRPHLLPRPSHKDGKGEYAALRAQRYLNRPHGGTVVVHYLKKTESWLETALALSGKPTMWTNGAGGIGKEWRMGGSPLLRSDGYIFQGRSQPRPMDDRVAPSEEAYTVSSSSSSSSKSKAKESQEKQQLHQHHEPAQQEEPQEQTQNQVTNPDQHPQSPPPQHTSINAPRPRIGRGGLVEKRLG